jgi:shikimate kinase/3-dehydroquinate synthase
VIVMTQPDTLTRIFLYGAPGSGKSTLGRALAEALDLPFIDLDERIVRGARQTIPEIFASVGEPGFRIREAAALQAVCAEPPAVVALGGGALLAEANRACAEAAGRVVCLRATAETLAIRTAAQPGTRPLLAAAGASAGANLAALLEARKPHYDSFALQLAVTNALPRIHLRNLHALLGLYHVSGMGEPYDIRVATGSLSRAGHRLATVHVPCPALVVADTATAPLYGETVMASLRAAGFTPTLITLPAGETHKTLATVQTIWGAAQRAGIDRGGLFIALGGGVVGDLTGFAAATWLRGVRWAVVPTTLLAMADSSIGGKTGADLPEGKNLVGAFHPPVLVLADPATLATLPVAEIRAGLAEVVKHGVIDDPDLFDACAALAGRPEAIRGDAAFVARALAVKVRTICQDPYEKGIRAALNLGHTIGHGVEQAMHFAISHGEAVAIGLVAEARIAETLGLAGTGLAGRLAAVLGGLGLPVDLPPGLDRAACLRAIRLDKKRVAGTVRFALPIRIGAVQTGVEVPVDILDAALAR